VKNKELKMDRVEMTVFGKRALVDSDMVKKMEKKQELTSQARSLQIFIKEDPSGRAYARGLLDRVMGKLIRLNRTIRPTVQFLE
jgi:undecaprenyl pyrophosphate synthase